MPKAKGTHHLKDEPAINLEIPGDPFALFYDYDQIRDRKLSKLKPNQKVVWLRKRLEITFLAPLRKLLNKSEPVFNELMSASPHHDYCAFSIAVMAVMLNGIEALGAFVCPDDRQTNKERFMAFLKPYMHEWSGSVRISGQNYDIGEILWKHFRNGITHGFCIEKPGSIEFLERERYQVGDQVLRVCPIHFFKDLEKGVSEYFSNLGKNDEALNKFQQRFNIVYPN